MTHTSMPNPLHQKVQHLQELNSHAEAPPTEGTLKEFRDTSVLPETQRTAERQPLWHRFLANMHLLQSKVPFC